MKAEELWILKFLRPGDKVVANKGASKVLAVGTVREPGYSYSHKNGHTMAVEWDTSYEQDIP
jgi:predicted Mrr-cat superfamily restriction endonuclease